MADLTRYNVLLALFISVGTFSWGFGFAVYNTSIGQPGFYSYFELDPTSAYTARILGATNALLFFGTATGAIAQGYLADSLGRKKALAIASATCLAGGALVAGSVAVPMLVVSRVLQGFGMGMLNTLVPLYLVEVSPPRQRGILTGLTILSFGLGTMSCAWIALACYYASNLTLAWRLPLALACVGPIVFLAGLPYVPESPRYLVYIDKLEEAWTVIKRLHSKQTEDSDQAAHAEYQQIVRQVQFDKQENIGYIEMFKAPTWRKRCILTFLLFFAAQSSGILGVGNYIVLIYASMGLSISMSLILLGVMNVVGTCAIFGSIVLVDRIGRRRLFLIGFPVLACCVLAEALLQRSYLGTTNRGGNAACVLFIYIFAIFYQCVDAPTFVWAAEIFPTTIRAKGLSLAQVGFSLGAITYATPAPLAYRNIGWRMYMLYFALCIVSFFFVYFFIPETKGIPIEEIGALFGDTVVAHLSADGHDIVEDQQEKAEHTTAVVEEETVKVRV